MGAAGGARWKSGLYVCVHTRACASPSAELTRALTRELTTRGCGCGCFRNQQKNRGVRQRQEQEALNAAAAAAALNDMGYQMS